MDRIHRITAPVAARYDIEPDELAQRTRIRLWGEGQGPGLGADPRVVRQVACSVASSALRSARRWREARRALEQQGATGCCVARPGGRPAALPALALTPEGRADARRMLAVVVWAVRSLVRCLAAAQRQAIEVAAHALNGRRSCAGGRKLAMRGRELLRGALSARGYDAPGAAPASGARYRALGYAAAMGAA